MDASLHHDPFHPDSEIDRFPDSDLEAAGIEAAERRYLKRYFGNLPDEEKEGLLEFWSTCDPEALKADADSLIEDLGADEEIEHERLVLELASAIEKANTKGSKMIPVAFPSDRFIRAGATQQEVTQLESEFEANTEEDKQAYMEYINAISDGDIANQLGELRTANHFKSGEQEDLNDPNPGRTDTSQTNTAETESQGMPAETTSIANTVESGSTEGEIRVPEGTHPAPQTYENPIPGVEVSGPVETVPVEEQNNPNAIQGSSNYSQMKPSEASLEQGDPARNAEIVKENDDSDEDSEAKAPGEE